VRGVVRVKERNLRPSARSAPICVHVFGPRDDAGANRRDGRARERASRWPRAREQRAGCASPNEQAL